MSKKTIFPATLLCDFYKVSHMVQYPESTEYIYSTWTPRSNVYFPQADRVVAFGIQGFIKKYLMDYFIEHFFRREKEEVVAEYVRYIKYTLGVENPNGQHIADLHDLGYLPVQIKAVKEGTLVPIRVPMLTIENTDPRFFWITNYLETIISNEIWLPMTSATIAYEYRKLLNEFALKTTGSTDGVDFQGHDFSMRGMTSLDSAASSGAGHLLSFVGTDTIPAIAYHEYYYGADIEEEFFSGSIPASEHSVMSAYGKVNELDLFKRFITEIYPSGFVSIVSDTWDFWKVIGEYLPALKEDIMNREGRLVIRPDSGDPVDIVCGNPFGETELEKKGLIEALWDIFGGWENDKGYKHLDFHIGAIYGDSITLERAEKILNKLEKKGFASTNIVFGIGSYTYQYNTRDTLGFAMKATYAQVDGEERLLFKDPKTDVGSLKKSQRGRVVVLRTQGDIAFIDGLNKEQSDAITHLDLLETVFENGELKREQTLSQIKSILWGDKDGN